MTCNRSEIYMSGTDTDFVWLEQQFADTKKFPVEALKGAAMRYEGRSCLTHLCRVVCGLDSAVLGEVEIIRQVKHGFVPTLGHNKREAVIPLFPIQSYTVRSFLPPDAPSSAA